MTDFFFHLGILKNSLFFSRVVYAYAYTTAMKDKPIPPRIREIAAVTRMERGKLSVIRLGSDGQPYYNLQHRENGHNVSEYVPRAQVATVEENIAAYQRFKALVDEHVAEIAEISRNERKSSVKKKRRIKKPSTSPATKKSKS